MTLHHEAVVLGDPLPVVPGVVGPIQPTKPWAVHDGEEPLRIAPGNVQADPPKPVQVVELPDHETRTCVPAAEGLRRPRPAAMPAEGGNGKAPPG